MLREKIANILKQFPTDSPEENAKRICLLLEDQIDLAGNGWWDDDPAMMEAVYDSDD